MLTTSIITTILFIAFTTRKDLSLIFNRSLTTLLIGSFVIGLKSSNFFILKEGISLFGGLFHNTSLIITFHLFIIFISIVLIQLTAFFSRSFLSDKNLNNKFLDNLIYNLELSEKTREQYAILEYPLIILFTIVGAMFLISCNDIVSIFLSIELQSYSLYLLCALYRNSESSTGASLTYFLLGGLSSCFILLAFSILYANSGITNLSSYYLFTNLSSIEHTINNIIHWYNNSYINYSLIILSIGLLFKISAAPFHFWSPDVYDAIPTIVTAFVANIAKISIFVLLIDIVSHTGNYYFYSINWTSCLLISSLMSLIVGTVLGLNQSRLKRLLAYSTISHLGFMLLAISINSVESMQAFIFYLMQYSISNLNIFIIIITIGYTLYMYIIKEKQDKPLVDENNSPIQYITQMRGYYYINPIITISLTIVIYSFVGIPPLIGFFGKQMVLSSALDKGYVFISLVAILTSVISAVYYLNIIKEMFFNESNYKLNNAGQNNLLSEKSNDSIINSLNTNYITTSSSNISLIISVLTLIILLFMLNPEEWLRMSNILAITRFN